MDLHSAINLHGLDSWGVGVVAMPWRMDYIHPGSPLETRMLKFSWCKSDTVRLANTYRLSTIRCLSRLKREIPRRDHSNCSLQIEQTKEEWFPNVESDIMCQHSVDLGVEYRAGIP